MYGKSFKIRRRPSVVVLAASLAAITIPAGQARNIPTHDPASQPPSALQAQSRVSQWIPTHDPASQPRDAKNVDRQLGSPDARVSVDPGLNTPSMCEVHLDPCGRSVGSLSKPGSNIGRELFPRADDALFRKILQDAAQEHGAAGFGNATQAVRVLKATPSVVAANYSHVPTEDRPKFGHK